MCTDYQILLQKFANFKEYIKSVSTDEKIIDNYTKMTDNQFLLFGMGFLVPNKNQIDRVVKDVCAKLHITEDAQHEKVKRYLECFIEYLEQINTPDALKEVIQNCVNDEKK